MIQEVKFQGLTHSPSDYETQDGELGTCLNLINEDGALKPIPKPIVVDENITIPEGASIEFVHKVTHGKEIHSHYIIRHTDDTWYWTERGGNGIKYQIDLLAINANSLCAIGNILCFIGNDSVKYFVWKNDDYIFFDTSKLLPSIVIYSDDKDTKSKDCTGTMDEDAFIRCFQGSSVYFTGTEQEGTRELFNAADTAANKELESLGEHYFKNGVFGVAALRLYDGTYFAVSSLFSIAKGKSPEILEFHTNSASDNIPTIKGTFTFYKINVSVNVSEDVYDFIQGIDVFLSEEIPDVAIKKKYKIDQYGDQHYGGQSGTITLSSKNILEYKEELNDIIFYKSLSIDKNGFLNYKELNRISRTEESISLASIQHYYTAKTSFLFNNRLHLADVTTIFKPMKFAAYNNPDYDRYVNYYDCIAMIIQTNSFEGIKRIYFKTKFPIKCNRVISIPLENAAATFYIKKDENSFYLYSPNFVSIENQNISISIDNNPYIEESNLTKISKSEWETRYKNWENNKDCIIGYQQNEVKVSEAENPFVFPAKNSVQVGSSVINALSANTRPISEGQFGDAPLYAFTDEGVWALMTNSEGTYDARQPVNRYICNNPKGILPIDDAVLFPTEHGIIMQQGSQSVCITDQLDGYPFNFMDMRHAPQIIATNDTPSDDISYVRFREYLKSADMIYDYYDSRIIVFNPGYKYAYVYSLKSKMWGTMESNLSKRINIYPEALAINKNGKIVNVYANDSKEDVSYFLCSRPLALSNNEIHKTMFSCIARGYFRDAARGKCGIVLYGSNDLFNWFTIKTSVDKYLRGMAGSPYKYFRIALIGSLSPDESISGVSTDFRERWQNKLR